MIIEKRCLPTRELDLWHGRKFNDLFGLLGGASIEWDEDIVDINKSNGDIFVKYGPPPLKYSQIEAINKYGYLGERKNLPPSVRFGEFGGRGGEKTLTVGRWVYSDAAEYIARCMGGEVREAANVIEDAIQGIFNTIVDGLLESRCTNDRSFDSNEYLVASGDRFSESIARAIAYRLPLGFYEEAPFSKLLFRSFLFAVENKKIDSRKWRFERFSDGDIKIIARGAPPPMVKPRAGWIKAKVVKLSDI